ncbi:MAG: leucyl/phenylalanyl-tRNA--protein transferase [Vicinamibacteria bacterium]
MPVYRLDERLAFPPPEEAEDGLLAVGGDLSPERLVLAYSQGIFPWYERGQPILWHSPDPRMVLLAPERHVPKSLAKLMRRAPFRLTLDGAFADVIAACAATPRPGQRTTWITPAMKRAYTALHQRGLAHSVEAWEGEQLVGGLYGVSLGAAFFGESMFARAPDASKIAFATLCAQLERWQIPLVDCQVHTPHLARFGATEWTRRRYLRALREALRADTRIGPWRFDADLSPAPAAPTRPPA